MQSQIFTVADLANRWHLSKLTIYRMLERGDLPGFKLGNSWRITEAVVEAVENNTLPFK
jgi:excisionase family DNA binding protein